MNETIFQMIKLLGIFPENISTYGAEIDRIFWLIFFFVAVAFVISLFILVYPLIRFRQAINPKAQYITGEKKAHMKWIVMALVALAGSDFIILFAEHGAWAKVEQEAPTADFHVGITGRQWNWIFIYPGPDGKLNTLDDVFVDEIDSELHVPVNKNVVFDLRSRDVLHSFFVTNLRLKQDAIPGRTITRWFNAGKEGKYEMACAEICGVLHARMRNFLRVESQEKVNEYLSELYKKSIVAN